MKTRFLWMILKISLPSGRHREGSKLNHFDKFLYFLPQRVGSEKGQKVRLGWNFYFVPQGVEHEKPVFMSFSRKYLVFGSGSEPFLYAYLTCGSETAPFWSQFSICYGLVAPFWSQIPSMASKVMPLSGVEFLPWHQNWCHFDYLLTYSQWGKPFIKVFLKNFSNNFVAARESVYCPFTYSQWERSFFK